VRARRSIIVCTAAVEVGADPVHLLMSAIRGKWTVGMGASRFKTAVDVGDPSFSNSAIAPSQQIQRELDLDREVDVTGRVDVLIRWPFHRRSRRGGDSERLMLMIHQYITAAPSCHSPICKCGRL